MNDPKQQQQQQHPSYLPSTRAAVIRSSLSPLKRRPKQYEQPCQQQQPLHPPRDNSSNPNPKQVHGVAHAVVTRAKNFGTVSPSLLHTTLKSRAGARRIGASNNRTSVVVSGVANNCTKFLDRFLCPAQQTQTQIQTQTEHYSSSRPQNHHHNHHNHREHELECFEEHYRYRRSQSNVPTAFVQFFSCGGGQEGCAAAMDAIGTALENNTDAETKISSLTGLDALEQEIERLETARLRAQKLLESSESQLQQLQRTKEQQQQHLLLQQPQHLLLQQPQTTAKATATAEPKSTVKQQGAPHVSIVEETPAVPVQTPSATPPPAPAPKLAPVPEGLAVLDPAPQAVAAAATKAHNNTQKKKLLELDCGLKLAAPSPVTLERTFLNKPQEQYQYLLEEMNQQARAAAAAASSSIMGDGKGNNNSKGIGSSSCTSARGGGGNNNSNNVGCGTVVVDDAAIPIPKVWSPSRHAAMEQKRQFYKELHQQLPHDSLELLTESADAMDDAAVDAAVQAKEVKVQAVKAKADQETAIQAIAAQGKLARAGAKVKVDSKAALLVEVKAQLDMLEVEYGTSNNVHARTDTTKVTKAPASSTRTQASATEKSVEIVDHNYYYKDRVRAFLRPDRELKTAEHRPEAVSSLLFADVASALVDLDMSASPLPSPRDVAFSPEDDEKKAVEKFASFLRQSSKAKSPVRGEQGTKPKDFMRQGRTVRMLKKTEERQGLVQQPKQVKKVEPVEDYDVPMVQGFSFHSLLSASHPIIPGERVPSPPYYDAAAAGGALEPTQKHSFMSFIPEGPWLPSLTPPINRKLQDKHDDDHAQGSKGKVVAKDGREGNASTKRESLTSSRKGTGISSVSMKSSVPDIRIKMLTLEKQLEGTTTDRNYDRVFREQTDEREEMQSEREDLIDGSREGPPNIPRSSTASPPGKESHVRHPAKIQVIAATGLSHSSAAVTRPKPEGFSLSTRTKSWSSPMLRRDPGQKPTKSTVMNSKEREFHKLKNLLDRMDYHQHQLQNGSFPGSHQLYSGSSSGSPNNDVAGLVVAFGAPKHSSGHQRQDFTAGGDPPEMVTAKDPQRKELLMRSDRLESIRDEEEAKSSFSSTTRSKDSEEKQQQQRRQPTGTTPVVVRAAPGGRHNHNQQQRALSPPSLQHLYSWQSAPPLRHPQSPPRRGRPNRNRHAPPLDAPPSSPLLDAPPLSEHPRRPAIDASPLQILPQQSSSSTTTQTNDILPKRSSSSAMASQTNDWDLLMQVRAAVGNASSSPMFGSTESERIVLWPFK